MQEWVSQVLMLSIMCHTPFTSFFLHWNSPNAIGSSKKPGARWQTKMPKNVSNSSTRGRIRCGLVTLLGFLIVAISLLLTEPAKVSGDYHTPHVGSNKVQEDGIFQSNEDYNPVKQSVTSYHSVQFSLLQRSNKNYSSKYAGLFLLQMRKKMFSNDSHAKFIPNCNVPPAIKLIMQNRMFLRFYYWEILCHEVSPLLLKSISVKKLLIKK